MTPIEDFCIALLVISFASCAEKTADQKRPGTTSHQSALHRNEIRGIWWSPEMFQSAAFQINDSTIFYPDTFVECKYELKGESLFVHRDDGSISGSAIIKVNGDTLLLLTMGHMQIFTRSETPQK